MSEVGYYSDVTGVLFRDSHKNDYRGDDRVDCPSWLPVCTSSLLPATTKDEDENSMGVLISGVNFDIWNGSSLLDNG